MTATVALATSADALDLDDDAPLLAAALADRGAASTLAVWDDADVDWSAFDLVVLRSTWDYPRRHAAFVRWADEVAAVTALRNAPEVVRWSSDKRYLLELADAGVPIVPTALHPAGTPPASLPDTGEFVVKPAVSAGSQDTERFAPGDAARARELVARLHGDGRDVLVQPYLERVDDHGETALVFLSGSFSHAIRKGPILAGATETIGGLFAAEQIDPRDPDRAERDAAEAALEAVPFDRSALLYARVDLLPTADGPPLVLEIELVEPSLFLSRTDGAAERFADAIVAAL